MKLITAVALLALMLTSCATKNTEFAIIKGQFIGEKEGREIHLCKVEHGETQKVAVTSLGSDGRFGFAYAVDEPGLYVVNVMWDKSLRAVKKDHNLKRVYLEKGTELEISISDGTYQLLASNSPKNNLMSEWNAQVDSVFSYSHGFSYNILDYTSFFPVLPEFVEQGKAFKSKIKSGDQSFDELMNLMVETDLNLAALNFIYTPRSQHPERKDYPDYYDYVLNECAPRSNRLLELPAGYDYTRLYTMFAILSSPDKPSRSEWNRVAMELIPNSLLKGYYGLNNINRFKAYDDAYLQYKELITPYLSTDYLKNKVNEFEMTIRKFEKGAEAFDFAGKDINGNEHRLSDYKGKLVYVDVWATWCGPCKAQIPALKELEKKFHGQPVTFLSISVDKMKDQQKWIDFVKTEHLEGVQLMADKAFDSDVAKAYGINAIPRFMLFDKEGKIVTIDAPRPSDEKISDLLKQYL
ncbi:TlpA family protein disulfide reductase [Carboxylicivirga sp. RSCT41]|uniref:TlpA family protein disulfide reductase n=1 Tax=Carboxylicivirga agarovorans TaxID=3417570 RepID=UPI003D34D8F8